MKLSSLFCLVEDLLREGHPLVDRPGCVTPKCLKTQNENLAYLFTPQNPSNACLWEADQNSLNEPPHMRIDQYYSDENSRLSLAHYTEVHQYPTEPQTVTMHVYFNESGHLETAAKTSLLEHPEQSTDFELSASQKRALHARVREIWSLFNALVFEKSRRRIQATQKAASAEQHLTRLSHHLENPVNRAEYKRIAAIFLEHIALMNRYDGYKHYGMVSRTAAMVQGLIQKMETQNQEAALKTSTSENTTTHQDSDIAQSPQTLNTGTEDLNTPRSKIDEKVIQTTPLKELLERLDPLLKQKTLSSQAIVEMAPIIVAINDQMLALLFEKASCDASHPTTKKKGGKKKSAQAAHNPKVLQAEQSTEVLQEAQSSVDQYHLKKRAVLNDCFMSYPMHTFLLCQKPPLILKFKFL